MNHGKEVTFDRVAYLQDKTEKDFIISSCGYFVAENSAYNLYNRHYHNGYALFYLHKGQARLPMPDGTNKILKEGEIIIFRPFEYPKITFLPDAINERYYVYFEGKNVSKCLEKLKLNDKRHYHVGDFSAHIKTFHKIMDDFAKRDYHDDIFRTTYFLNILTAVSNVINPAEKTSYPETFKKILHTIDNEYFEKITLPELAASFSLSVSTLKRYFKKYTGKAPIDYINDTRFNRAKLMLIESDMSIAEISYSVGFEDALYFSKFFKKKTGVSPKTFRENLHKTE